MLFVCQNVALDQERCKELAAKKQQLLAEKEELLAEKTSQWLANEDLRNEVGRLGYKLGESEEGRINVVLGSLMVFVLPWLFHFILP